MKRWILLGSAIVIAVSCGAPPVSPVQEWSGPIRSEPDNAMAKGLFDQVVDGTFSFDEEAFYWLCANVCTNSARRELLAASSASPTPVRQMLERPADFRGLPVVVEGILRSREEYEIHDRPELGRLTQLELSVPGSRAIVTVVCTERPAVASPDAPLRATGYFLKSRQFRTTDGQSGAGVVLVTNGMISTPTSREIVSSSREYSLGSIRTEWLVAWIAVFAVIWLFVRRRLRDPIGARNASRMRMPRRVHEGTGDSDFAWMTTTDPKAKERSSRGKTGSESNP